MSLHRFVVLLRFEISFPTLKSALFDVSITLFSFRSQEFIGYIEPFDLYLVKLPINSDICKSRLKLNQSLLTIFNPLELCRTFKLGK